MEFTELIEAFASKYGVEGLTSDGGVASIVVDDMKCVILDEPEADCVTVCGEIGLPPPHADVAVGELMLKSNFLLNATEGSVLSMNPETGAYVVFRKIPRLSADLEALASAVEKIADQVADWQGVLNGVKSAVENLPESGNSDMGGMPLSGSGFMQV